ncbi:tumor necrosis factor ligand superfamily member 18 [Paramormyrops kingsleyae]|uniref:tumor necrosis factor ligand superfamily member 18 n=1 Tax=Paramormyrops kingsleyae TaxID=1676925 RepID=UPI003B96BCCD
MSSTETALHQALARHQCLNSTLMLWVTLLSLAQAITLVLLFTRQDNPSTPCLCKPANTTQQFLVNYLKKGSNQAMDELHWMSEDDIKPIIAKDGRYFLYIQVTLQSDAANLTYTVHIKKSNNQKPLISLTLTKKSNEITTGFHGRQVKLDKGDELKVTCAPPALINTNEFATHMGTYLTEAY